MCSNVDKNAIDSPQQRKASLPGMFCYGLRRKVPFLWKFYLIQVLISLSIIFTYLYLMPIMTPQIVFSIKSINQYLRIFNKSDQTPGNLPRIDNGSKSSSFGTESQPLPPCIIFGVSKCGTRAVVEYIKQHPDVVAPSKEIHFFDNETLQRDFGLDWYHEQMPKAKSHQMIVEKSPDYFQHPRSAQRIYEANNNTKLILLLRDPVDRLVSEYMQLVEKNPLLPRFEEWVIDSRTHGVNTRLTSVMVSAYSEFLVEWLKVFTIDNIHIIESYNLRVNPLMEMKLVEKFLHLRPYLKASDFYYNTTRGFYCNRVRSSGAIKCLGKSKGRSHIPVREDIIDTLYTFYHPYNMELNRLLGMKFPWSRFRRPEQHYNTKDVHD